MSLFKETSPKIKRKINEKLRIQLLLSRSLAIFFLTVSPEYVQTGPYNRAYTESQLEAGGGFILPDFNEEQVTFSTFSRPCCRICLTNCRVPTHHVARGSHSFPLTAFHNFSMTSQENFHALAAT